MLVVEALGVEIANGGFSRPTSEGEVPAIWPPDALLALDTSFSCSDDVNRIMLASFMASLVALWEGMLFL